MAEYERLILCRTDGNVDVVTSTNLNIDQGVEWTSLHFEIDTRKRLNLIQAIVGTAAGEQTYAAKKIRELEVELQSTQVGSANLDGELSALKKEHSELCAALDRRNEAIEAKAQEVSELNTKHDNLLKFYQDRDDYKDRATSEISAQNELLIKEQKDILRTLTRRNNEYQDLLLQLEGEDSIREERDYAMERVSLLEKALKVEELKAESTKASHPTKGEREMTKLIEEDVNTATTTTTAPETNNIVSLVRQGALQGGQMAIHQYVSEFTYSLLASRLTPRQRFWLRLFPSARARFTRSLEYQVLVSVISVGFPAALLFALRRFGAAPWIATFVEGVVSSGSAVATQQLWATYREATPEIRSILDSIFPKGIDVESVLGDSAPTPTKVTEEVNTVLEQVLQR